MKLAVMADKIGPGATVPEVFEESGAMLIWESDNDTIVESMQGRPVSEYVDVIVKHWCEAVVCGGTITAESFEPLAKVSITRYNGSGLSLVEAAEKALYNALPLVTDFTGGTGCHSGTGSCEDGDCAHD